MKSFVVVTSRHTHPSGDTARSVTTEALVNVELNSP